jgi:SAM-dependent methyltransferase
MQVEVLDGPVAAREFYEARYRRGYMDRWEPDRERRLLDVLAPIELPAGARVLDFGCGSGALTRLLRRRWPDCAIHGADISRTAVAHARARAAALGIQFHLLDAGFVRDHRGCFDFVFTHHVLEHVYDLGATVADLAGLLAPGGRMLHVLPCGNPGSLPHWLCLQRADGIDPAAGNRFFFEESSHLRRLRSDELAQQFARHGCGLTRASFGYHWLGALRLFTEVPPPDLCRLLDPRPCRPAARPAVLALLVLALGIAALRAPVQVLLRCRRLLQQALRFRTRRLGEPASIALLLLAVPALCLLPLSLAVEGIVRLGDRREWRRRRHDARGAEMLLEFTRGPT